METLSRVSKDKLVVVVTHNYDQAEPYVTRKITMHDGRIIEDKKVQGRRAGEGMDPDDPYGLGKNYDLPAAAAGASGDSNAEFSAETAGTGGRAARNTDKPASSKNARRNGVPRLGKCARALNSCWA
jgi:energy-coupling factor transporter ATP-binding protein EcfA2